MSLHLYNTYSKREEEFKPLKAGSVTMYTCGPTVYGRPHIGNYSSFLMADVLRRWLEAGHRYSVKHVKNITDVGHLVADADIGDDKVEAQARTEKVDPLDIAKRYTQMYLEDEVALNLLEPFARPRATSYIQEMLAMVKELVKNGNAYETADGFYFSVETFPAYGTLSGNTLDKLDAGSRVKVDEAKKHPADFALWKKCTGNNGHHLLRWSFQTGDLSTTEGDDAASGFPGWHIECSAMSSALLGKTIDIHTGGEDNIFPHHECEIAQSSCAFSLKQPFAQYWLHKRRIDLAGEKMSKSLGNVLTIPTVISKGYSPLDLRFYFLSVHYRTNLKFTWKGMDEARASRRKILEWMENAGENSIKKSDEKFASVTLKNIQKFDAEFSSAMDTDLNVSGALASVHACMHATNAAVVSDDAREALQTFIDKIRHTFGCFEPEAESIPPEVQSLVSKRALAREKKDFKESDRLRDEMHRLGYEVRDEKNEQRVRKL